MTYESILDFWKKQNIKNANKLASVLSSYSVNFAYNSGKTENEVKKWGFYWLIFIIEKYRSKLRTYS